MNTTARPITFGTPQSSRLVALALLGMAALLLGAMVTIPAWWLYQREHSTAKRMVRQLESYTALNQLRPKLLQAAETLKAKDTKKYFLKGTTPALMGADLQDVVKGSIETNNGRVLSSQLLAQKDDNGYRLINGNIQMTANIQNLRQVLYALESREPYLFIENLIIRAQVPSGFKPQAGFEPDMFVQFDVSGLAPTGPEQNAGKQPPAKAAVNETAGSKT